MAELAEIEKEFRIKLNSLEDFSKVEESFDSRLEKEMILNNIYFDFIKVSKGGKKVLALDELGLMLRVRDYLSTLAMQLKTPHPEGDAEYHQEISIAEFREFLAVGLLVEGNISTCLIESYKELVFKGVGKIKFICVGQCMTIRRECKIDENTTLVFDVSMFQDQLVRYIIECESTISKEAARQYLLSLVESHGVEYSIPDTKVETAIMLNTKLQKELKS
jgi:uncharacterized protein YjbK